MGSSGEAQSTAQTSFYGTVVQSMATAPTGGTATTNAIAQAGGAGRGLRQSGPDRLRLHPRRPRQSFHTATLIGGESNIVLALLGPILGAAILGANYAPDGGGESDVYTAT